MANGHVDSDATSDGAAQDEQLRLEMEHKEAEDRRHHLAAPATAATTPEGITLGPYSPLYRG